ncbi:MAG TPA: segregation/condensation protein A [Clostridia bacterium]
MPEILEQKEDFFIFKLADFEGPLDLLLHLVKEAKIEIKNIFVSDITEQFLAHMEQLNTIDMDKAAEFVDVASTLLEIKVKSLLPKMDDLIPEEDDPKERLIKQLEEYKLFKEAGEKLKEQENVSRFYKQPDEKVNDYKVVLKDMSLNGLLDAFSSMLHKLALEKRVTQPRKIVKDRFTVAEKIEEIKQILSVRKTMSFFNLFEKDFTKSEMINTFLALLELLRLHFLRCTQNTLFGDIILTYSGEDNGN